MEISGRIARQIVLLSLTLLLVPTVAFPELFGTSLMKTSMVFVMYELVFYGFVLYFMRRESTLIQLIQWASVCLVYRLMLGAAFGLLCSAMYLMDVAVSVTLGMSGYVPGILLHIVSVPFVLRPAILPAPSAVLKPVSMNAPDQPVVTSLAASKARGFSTGSTPAPMASISVEEVKPGSKAPIRTYDTVSTHSGVELTGFDRAVRYIGEDSSVLMAAVVDHEGLVLGSFHRDEWAAEDWAPYGLLLADVGHSFAARTSWGDPEKADFYFAEKRVVVAREGFCRLVVFGDRHTDEILNIRINQALEMIRKYVAERYGEMSTANAESVYESSTS